MNIDQIAQFIINNPKTYPGLHQESCSRTSEAFKPLELKSQMLIIWRAFCEYLGEKTNEGKGINIKNFGAFTFEVQTELPKLGLEYGKAMEKSFKELLTEKKTTYKMRPCFVVDPKLKKVLTRYKGKEELSKPKSQASVYQQGFQMTFLNPVPIAAAVYLHKNVVVDTLDAIFTAIYDLITMGKNIQLKFGFCNIYFYERNLTFTYKPDLQDKMKNDVHETSKRIKRGITPVSKNWKVSAYNKWERSNLSTLLERPHSPLIKTVDNKVQMLKIMSLDMASVNNKKA